MEWAASLNCLVEAAALLDLTSTMRRCPVVVVVVVVVVLAALLPAASTWRAGPRPRRDVDDPPEDGYRLPRHLEPAGYRLALVPDVKEGVFWGEVRINVTCRRATSTVVLHAHPELSVSKVVLGVNPQASSVAAREIEVRHIERDLEKQWLIIMLDEKLQKDNSYRLDLSFRGSLDDREGGGMYRSKFIDPSNNRTQWYVDTNMKMDSARHIFPCFDEPEYKAVFDVKIATLARQHVFSIMPLADIVDMNERPGWYWKHFVKSPPISTMSFGMFMFEFQHYSLSKGVLRVVGRSAMRNDIEKALERLEEVYQYFLDYLGTDIPLPKLDLVVLPDAMQKDNIGSFGLITVEEDLVDSMAWLAYLTSAQWVGHLMTPKWFGDMNVCLGLNLHLSYSFLEKRNYLNTWDGYESYYIFSQFEPYNRKYSPRDYGDIATASWFVRMMQYAVTEDTVMGAFRKLFQLRQYETFSERDLWRLLTERGWEDATLPRDVRVEEAAHSWLDKPRFPVVVVTRDYARRSATLQQHVFLNKKQYPVPDKENMLWYIPIMYLTPNNLNISAARPVAWMKNQREITIRDLPGSNQFVIVNPADIGMFMVNYDPTNWALLAEALHRKVLPVAVRTKLLRDSWNLAFAGELNFNTAMNMTLFLEDETEHDVWEVMFSMFYHISTFLDGTTVGEKFKRYVGQLTTRAMEKMGHLRGNQDDEKNVYRVLRYIMKRLSNQKPTQRQIALFEAWARGGSDPSSKTTDAICLTVRHGSMEQFERALTRLMDMLRQRQDSRSPRQVKLITNCARQPDKVERLLRTALLVRDTGFSDEDRHTVVNQLSAHHSGYSTMFSFLGDNWEALRQGLEDKPDLWVDLIENAMTNFNTEEEVKMVARVFAEKRDQLGNAAPVVQAKLQEMTARAQWSRESAPVLEHWLDLHLPATEGDRDLA
ncbi:aminopeptidase N-like [Bacillus rossius redtenbacheri]|uniref:aminopeptidase N-like n=1 Tax=Bacillus rossius redtenbacheri TaxID=93214 RepID=UPI002FDD20EE